MEISEERGRAQYDGLMQRLLEKMRLRDPVHLDAEKLREAHRRGEAAKRLRSDPDLKQAFDVVEDVYMRAWKGSDFLDVELRERAFLAVSLLGDLRNYLMACVENGEAARAQMEKIARQ